MKTDLAYDPVQLAQHSFPVNRHKSNGNNNLPGASLESDPSVG